MMRRGFAIATMTLLGLLLGGCPIRVDPTTDTVCPTLPNCGRCASDINCAWCPSPNGETRDCYSRSALPAECQPVQVRLTEDCPEEGELGERAGGPQ